MCAIFGGKGIGIEMLEQMSAAQEHRGPDGSGFKLGAEGGFSLGMNRLAILDLKDGMQPFERNGVTTVCNGEIYNWRALRAELEQQGYEFRTQCDCEVLPAAWLEWREEMFLRLNGMFAMAILDGDDLILARDRCGQKPLYYSSEAQLFSSEIRGLSAVGVPLKPDPHVLHRYLMLRYVPEPETFWQGIRLVPAGHFLRWGKVPEPYWEPKFSSERRTDYQEGIKELERLSLRAVERCLQADVPVAAYLSAGVDSSLLLEQINRLGGEVQAVGLGFGARSDETTAAAEFARSLGIKFSRVELDPTSLRELPRVVGQMERPVGDLLTLAFDAMAERVSGLGAKVVLGGEGADELFGGYSFQKIPALCDRLPPALLRTLGWGLKRTPGRILDYFSEFPAALGRSGQERVATFLAEFARSSDWWKGVGLRALFTSRELEMLLIPDLIIGLPELRGERDSSTLGERHLVHQFEGWLQDWSLIRQDKNTMAHAVESRAPYLDNELIDFSFQIPEEWKYRLRQDKRIWRDMAGRSLDPKVSNRSKQPFYLPLEDPLWLREFWNLLDGTLPALEETGWFRENALSALRQRAKQSGEFLPLKQLAALAILSLHIQR